MGGAVNNWVVLNSDFLNNPEVHSQYSRDFIQSTFDGSGGVMLVQHYATSGIQTAKIVLRAVNKEDVNDQITRELNISISSVEDMFMHIDLTKHAMPTSVANGYEPKNRHLWEDPPNFPDDPANNSRFVYVHGYNNNIKASRGSNSENFKRLYLLGSKSKYIAVSWLGWETQLPELVSNHIGYKCPDYQRNVINAFETAEHFANFLRNAQWRKEKTVVAAHSLGNMLVSSAINDWTRYNEDRTPAEKLVDRYIMLNSAVSQEAYGTQEDFDLNANFDINMVHRDWAEHLENLNENGGVAKIKDGRQFLFSWNWSRLYFDGIFDSRHLLTWYNRFSAVPVLANPVNIWSKGDRAFFLNQFGSNVDFITPPAETLWFGREVWSIQEKRKGRGGPANDKVGGWGKNSYYNIYVSLSPNPDEWTTGGAPVEQCRFPETIPFNNLKSIPYFEKGELRSMHAQGYGLLYGNLYDTESITAADDLGFRNALLAVMIPSRLNGMGRAIKIPAGFKQATNLEMQSVFNPTGQWPIQSHEGNVNEYWDHGHFQTIPLPYVHRLYTWIKNEIE